MNSLQKIDFNNPKYLYEGVEAFWTFEILELDENFSILLFNIIKLMNKVKILTQFSVYGTSTECSDIENLHLDDWNGLYESIENIIKEKRELKIIETKGIIFHNNEEIEVDGLINFHVDFIGKLTMSLSTRNNVWLPYCKRQGGWFWQIDVWKENNSRLKYLLHEVKDLLRDCKYDIFPLDNTYEPDEETGIGLFTNEGLYCNPMDILSFIKFEGYPEIEDFKITDFIPPLSYDGYLGNLKEWLTNSQKNVL